MWMSAGARYSDLDLAALVVIAKESSTVQAHGVQDSTHFVGSQHVGTAIHGVSAGFVSLAGVSPWPVAYSSPCHGEGAVGGLGERA
jgi:hypothetical protein